MKQFGASEILEKVRAICLAFPEGAEVEAWQHPTFRAGKKMFAAYGEDPVKGPTIGMKVGFDKQDELLEDPRFYPTPYSAHQGWVSICLGDDTDWDEIAELLKGAYRQVANKRMLKLLDEQ